MGSDFFQTVKACRTTLPNETAAPPLIDRFPGPTAKPCYSKSRQFLPTPISTTSGTASE